MAKVFEFYDHVDVLVNNAGVATTTPKVDFLDKDLSEWRKIIDVDLIGVAALIHEIAPKMIQAGRGGEIINITSIGAVSVSGCKLHHNAPYNAAKAGADVFTRYLAITLGDYGIRVNAIRPGPHHSDLEVHLSDYMRNLIDNEMPTIVIATNVSIYEKTISNIQEIKSRGGKVIAVVTTGDSVVSKMADHCIWVPETAECLTPLLSSIPLQLFAYYIAVNKGRDVDQPRNLAKSVTVE